MFKVNKRWLWLVMWGYSEHVPTFVKMDESEVQIVFEAIISAYND